VLMLWWWFRVDGIKITGTDKRSGWTTSKARERLWYVKPKSKDREERVG